MSALLDAIRRAHPSAPAVRDATRALSYGELAHDVAREVDALHAAGARRWGLLAANGVGWAVADLALHVGGHVHVPLPAWFTDAQLRHALDDAGIDGVLTDDPARLARGWPEFASQGHASASGLAMLTRARRAPHANVPPWTAKITYTSGSTGEPKGVPLSAASLETVAASVVGATRALDVRRHLAVLPLATLLENVAGLYAALLSGAECVLPADAGVGFGGVDAARLLQTIGTHAPDSLILVPELLRILVAARRQGWPAPPSLKFVAIGGAAVSPDLLHDAATLGLPVFEGYGLSECTSVVCLNVPGANRPGSVGRPLAHAAVRVDATGEVHVRGAVACGHDEIATGDLGEFDADGFLWLRGRRKSLYITSLGRNVQPEWIERELLHDPAVAQAVAFGEARPHACALLVPSHARVTDADLARAVAAANARLPDYARVHDWARVPPFTPSDGTLTANGRPRRDRILERHAPLLATLGTTSIAC